MPAVCCCTAPSRRQASYGSSPAVLALEPEQKLPDKPEQIAGLYHGLLADRGVLILADNAKDSDQVRPLIPSPPSALLARISHQKVAKSRPLWHKRS